MPDLTPELESLYLLYGTSIPPLPRQPRIAQRTVRWDTTLDGYAQRAANAREYGYDGDVNALIRHAVSLFLMALAKSSGQDVSPIRFQMEALRREREEEDYTAFVEYAQATITDAGGYRYLASGRRQASDMLRLLTNAIAHQPSRKVRLRMQSYLTTHGRFVKMVKELGDESLKSWLELAT